MTIPMLIDRTLIATICVFVFTLRGVSGADDSRTNAVPASVQRKFESLFQKYYPKAAITNQQANGIHIEYEVTRFASPPTDPARKHENPIQSGPKKGGIECYIYLEKGDYNGQLAMPRFDGQFASYLIDRKAYKQ